MAKKKPLVKRAKKKLAFKLKHITGSKLGRRKNATGTRPHRPRKNQSMDQPHYGHPSDQQVIPEVPGPESVTMTEIAAVKKLTTKIIVGKKIGKIEARQALYSIIGVATGLKSGESNYGAWTALVGRFEAERTADGTLFSAPLVLLPEECSGAIIQAVRLAGGIGIEFAFSVAVEPTLTSPGYVYDIATVVSPRRNDMLASLRSTLQAYLSDARL